MGGAGVDRPDAPAPWPACARRGGRSSRLLWLMTVLPARRPPPKTTGSKPIVENGLPDRVLHNTNPCAVSATRCGLSRANEEGGCRGAGGRCANSASQPSSCRNSFRRWAVAATRLRLLTVMRKQGRSGAWASSLAQVTGPEAELQKPPRPAILIAQRRQMWGRDAVETFSHSQVAAG